MLVSRVKKTERRLWCVSKVNFFYIWISLAFRFKYRRQILIVKSVHFVSNWLRLVPQLIMQINIACGVWHLRHFTFYYVLLPYICFAFWWMLLRSNARSVIYNKYADNFSNNYTRYRSAGGSSMTINHLYVVEQQTFLSATNWFIEGIENETKLPRFVYEWMMVVENVWFQIK